MAGDEVGSQSQRSTEDTAAREPESQATQEPLMVGSSGEVGAGADYEALLAEALGRLEGDRMEPLVLAMLGGGLRVEEAIPLWWQDLEFDQITLMDGSDGLMCHASIYKAWTPRDGLHGTKNRFSTRVVPIPEPFSSRLYGLAVEGPRAPLYALSPSNVRRDWARLFKLSGPLSGLPRVKMKDMRAIHETLMQDSGALDTVNARMHGRTNVQTGYRHYLRPSAALDSAAQAMGERVKRAI